MRLDRYDVVPLEYDAFDPGMFDGEAPPAEPTTETAEAPPPAAQEQPSPVLRDLARHPPIHAWQLQPWHRDADAPVFEDGPMPFEHGAYEAFGEPAWVPEPVPEAPVVIAEPPAPEWVEMPQRSLPSLIDERELMSPHAEDGRQPEQGDDGELPSPPAPVNPAPRPARNEAPQPVEAPAVEDDYNATLPGNLVRWGEDGGAHDPALAPPPPPPPDFGPRLGVLAPLPDVAPLDRDAHEALIETLRLPDAEPSQLEGLGLGSVPEIPYDGDGAQHVEWSGSENGFDLSAETAQQAVDFGFEHGDEMAMSESDAIGTGDHDYVDMAGDALIDEAAQDNDAEEPVHYAEYFGQGHDWDDYMAAPVLSTGVSVPGESFTSWFPQATVDSIQPIDSGEHHDPGLTSPQPADNTPLPAEAAPQEASAGEDASATQPDYADASGRSEDEAFLAAYGVPHGQQIDTGAPTLEWWEAAQARQGGSTDAPDDQTDYEEQVNQLSSRIELLGQGRFPAGYGSEEYAREIVIRDLQTDLRNLMERGSAAQPTSQEPATAAAAPAAEPAPEPASAASTPATVGQQETLVTLDGSHDEVTRIAPIVIEKSETPIKSELDGLEVPALPAVLPNTDDAAGDPAGEGIREIIEPTADLTPGRHRTFVHKGKDGSAMGATLASDGAHDIAVALEANTHVLRDPEGRYFYASASSTGDLPPGWEVVGRPGETILASPTGIAVLPVGLSGSQLTLAAALAQQALGTGLQNFAGSASGEFSPPAWLRLGVKGSVVGLITSPTVIGGGEQISEISSDMRFVRPGSDVIEGNVELRFTDAQGNSQWVRLANASFSEQEARDAHQQLSGLVRREALTPEQIAELSKPAIYVPAPPPAPLPGFTPERRDPADNVFVNPVPEPRLPWIEGFPIHEPRSIDDQILTRDQEAQRKFRGRVLAQEFAKDRNFDPSLYEAHHIIPLKEYAELQALRDKFAEWEIDLDDVANGVALPANAGSGTGTPHRDTQNNPDYVDKLLGRFEGVATREQALERLADIKQELRNGSFFGPK